MKKHINKIILGVLFLGATAVGIVFSILHPIEKAEEEPKEEKMSSVEFQAEDYKDANNEELYINKDSYLHYDQTTIRGLLKEIVYEDDKIEKFIIEAPDKTIYEIERSELDLISIKVEEENDTIKAEIVFRTGGRAVLIVGDEAMLYMTHDNTWSLDERKHVKSEKMFFSGTIEDFVFLPNVDKEDEIYISHIVVKNEQGENAEIYFNSIYGASIKSLQAVDVYYVGETKESQVYNIDEGESYKIELKTREKIYTLQKGMKIDLVKKEHNGYWEIYSEADTELYKAKVESFTFGSSGHNIASLDYINLALDDGTKIQLTMLQTGAKYAVPYGDYTKVYTYFAHEKVLTGIEVSEDWMMELYFENESIIELKIGTEVWVRQNEDGIWYLEYTYQEPIEEENTEN
ncbi:MAG: hypothetical protein AB1Z23_08190 [Eubacteriales bacterium]